MKRRRPINYDTCLTRTIKAWMPMMKNAFDRPRWIFEYFADHKGLPGPVTFEGTPGEVIQKLRRWQKGLKP